MINGHTVSLKEYVDTKFQTLDIQINLAREQVDKRLDGMNGFRQALKDQSENFVTRPEHDFVTADIRELRESKAELAGKASAISVHLAWLISGVSLFVSVISLVMRLK